MRICTPHFGIDPETTSGGETYELELLRRLAECDMDVDIILARHKKHPDGIPNWTVHRLAVGRGLRWPVAAMLFPAAIKRVYEARRFDVLRVHSVRYVGPAALIARRRYHLDVPVIAHHHHVDPGHLNHVIDKPVIERCDHVIAVSEFARRQLQDELNARVDHVSVIPNGIERKFRPHPPRRELLARLGLEGHPVVLFLGGLKARKNLDALISSFQGVIGARPDARLLIAGGGPLLGSLQRHVARVGLTGQIVFTGYVPESEKADYYNLAQVFVFPSTLEGFGRPVGEAMSAGVPVVVSSRGALPELVVPGHGGFVCDADDPSSFARAVLVLLENAELRTKFGEANRERIDTSFRWERVVQQTQQVYEETLRRWRAKRAGITSSISSPSGHP